MTTIRMYNVGIGDCFLLRFERASGPWFMLIDCGLLRGSADEQETLKAVAADIAITTNGHLDVIVATHEHQDHLSGFWYAQDAFKNSLTIGQVWLAWTEKPGDTMATHLKGTMALFEEQLEKTIETLKKDNRRGLNQDALAAVESVLAFAGFDKLLGVSERISINQKALQFLKEVPTNTNEPVVYHEPSSVHIVDELPGVRFFVLGPPRSDLIKKSDPSKRMPEVYNFAGSDRSNYALMIPAWDGEDAEDKMDAMPFDASHQVTLEDAQKDDFFAQKYWNDIDENGKEQRYRRIDDDWLHAVGDLALQLDSDTNNTSLSLAIELINSNEVLLFPGDAQVGNWLSWDSCTWADFPNLNAKDLLARTVFYKVGHHGSHNATLRESGLERMTDARLVAMIPVDEEFARSKKKWDMPFGSLYKRLVEKTQGRMIQADGRTPPIPDPRYPLVVNDSEQQIFLASLMHSTDKRPGTNRPLWTEYTV